MFQAPLHTYKAKYAAFQPFPEHTYTQPELRSWAEEASSGKDVCSSPPPY